MKKEDVMVGKVYRVNTPNACSNSMEVWRAKGSVKNLIRVKSNNEGFSIVYDILDDQQNSFGRNCNCFTAEHLEEINSNSNNKKSFMSTLTEKFTLALTKEPQKTFRKVGVTNGDDILTEDGEKVFLAWLLNTKFAEDFKKDVADEMLKDLEEKK